MSLAGCIALSVVCISTNQKLKRVDNYISNYKSQKDFKVNDKEYSLLDILNWHEQQIFELYNCMSKIQNNQMVLQDDIDRSNRFLSDYNSSRLFDDDWPMKMHY